MPCDSSHMEANGFEIAMSQVFQLLDELDGKQIDPSSWSGYDKRVYCAGLGSKEADKAVAKLCARLQTVDVTKYSLEMQMWWRDHLKADAEKEARNKAQREQEEAKKRALSKLTAKERKLLGHD